MDVEKEIGQIITDLELPPRFTFTLLLQNVKKFVGKEIFVASWHFPPQITGACLHGNEGIYIFYADGTPIAHQQLIIIHEITHIVRADKGEGLNGEEERTVIEAIKKTNAKYSEAAKNVLLRRMTRSTDEGQVDQLAVGLMQRLIPERQGTEATLEKMDLD
ncbi:MAG: hypothetical protein K8L97_31285 [Anaerolineae bacterium]|nr:hypothetical protein [Anaerolineae bacterium]